MSQSQLGDALKIETVDLDDVIPYWRNPRRIPEEAVNAVAESIRRYGYMQPIVVDEDYTIILGHTRYAAFRRLKIKELQIAIAVGLSADRVKQLRILDNRVAEFNLWNFDKLVDELGVLDAQLMTGYFPEVMDSFEEDKDPIPVSWDAESDTAADPSNTQVEFVCPHCFHSWEQEIKRQQLMAGLIKGGN